MKVGVLLEYCLLVKFYFHNDVRKKPFLIALWLGQYIVIALLLSFAYRQGAVVWSSCRHFNAGNYDTHPASKITVLYTSRVFVTLTTLPFLASYLAPERQLLQRGFHGLQVAPATTLLAKFTVYVLVREVLFLPYAIIVYPLTALRPGVDHFLMYVLILWIHQLCKSALGFFVSACFASTPVLSKRI